MNATAKEILAADKARLILCGAEDGRPQWLGSKQQFATFNRMLDFHERFGRFPKDDYPYREVEPGVFLK